MNIQVEVLIYLLWGMLVPAFCRQLIYDCCLAIGRNCTSWRPAIFQSGTQLVMISAQNAVHMFFVLRPS